MRSKENASSGQRRSASLSFHVWSRLGVLEEENSYQLAGTSTPLETEEEDEATETA
jgi:hypothetical protein